MADDERAPDPEPASYAAAVDELEAILAEVEADDVDVDLLADRVARAAALLRWCRARVLAARDAVEEAADGLSED